MTVHRVVCLDLPSKDNVLLLGGNLEGVVMPFPAKEARQDLNEAGVGSHEVVVDQASPVHAHLQPRLYMLTTRLYMLTTILSMLTTKLYMLTTRLYMLTTRVHAPSRGRALVLATVYIPAGNHRGMPCTLGQSRLNQKCTC